MRPGYSSSWEDELEGAPSAPPMSDESYDEYSDIPAPQWVQRIYGPPPQRQPQAIIPVPAAIWSPQIGGVEAQPWQEVTPIPAQAPHYDIRAFIPGMQPYQLGQTPGAGLRVRSPSAATVQSVSTNGGQQDVEAQQQVKGSPTKTPLLHTGAAAAAGGTGARVRRYSHGEDPTMPSRSLAIRERRRRQLRTCDKDAFGVPLPNTGRPFSIFATPFSVAEVCTGLGVYLASLQAAVLLALLLSVCMIYPLVDNIKSQRWAREYTLYTGANTPAASCPKGWDLTSWITELTIGGHCNAGPYMSRYDCAAQCIWEPKQMTQSQCRGVPAPGSTPQDSKPSAFNATAAALSGIAATCAVHLPCVENVLDPYSPDGPCYCCRMEMDPNAAAKNPRVAAGQLWTLFVAQLIFMAWMLYLMHAQLKVVHIQGSLVVGPSDFSVWISGIKRNRAGDSPLAHWCGQFGNVVAAFNVPSVGDALRVGRRVSELLVRKAESDAIEGSTSCNPLQWVYKMIAVGRPRAISETLERQQRKLEIYERQESEATGQGLATFEFSESAAECVEQFDRAPLRSLLDTSTFGCTDFTPRLHGCLVNVVRAPEPSDILWEHTNCTGTPAYLRRLWSWMLTVLIILAGAGIQYGLAVMAEGLRKDRILAEYAAGAGAEWAVREAAAKTRRLRWVAVGSGVVVVVINLTIMVVVRLLSWYERWTTRTSMERWVMLKLSLSQLTNAFAAPVLAAYASGNKSGWYARGGLMEAAFFVQCANALVPPLVHFLGLGDNLKYYLLSPFARTQSMLDKLLAPPLFPMAEQHAASVTTLGLAMFYMPVLPISPMISLVGLSISYCVNKWVALRRAAAPPNLSGMVTSSLNWLLRMLPLIQLVLMKELYFRGYPTIDPVFYTGLSFWLLFMLAPIRALLGAVRRRRRPPATSGLSYHRLLGGKRLGVGDVYAPLVPKPCSRKFKEHMAATFSQLAPAAFDSIINGEEVAKFLFGPAGGGAGNGGGGEVVHRSKDPAAAGLPPNPSIRASIAAGIQETFNLIWKPQDADHPEDEFLARAGALPTAPRAPHRPHSGSTSDSFDPSRPPPPPTAPSHHDSRGTGGGDDNGGMTPRSSSAYIPAIRQRNGPTPPPPARGAPPAGLPRAPPIAHNRPPAAPQPDDMFRPLGSGLPSGEFDLA